MTALARRTPPSSLTGPVGPNLRWAWARAALPEVKLIGRRLGGTVNDVVLTAIASGFRALLLARGEALHERAVRSLVPVSVRSQHERGEYNNRVAAMFARLPVDVDDPVERLAETRARMERLKRSRESVATEALVGLSGVAPPLLVGSLLRIGARYAGRFGQRNVNTVTTNVPGPQRPLYLLGRRLVEAFPYVPIAEGVRIGVAIFSYDGSITFGVTGDYDSTDDIDVFTAGIEEGIAELLKAAEQTHDVAAGAEGGRP
jgi:diacylglycerol O-acyltransferase / wax synthase